MRDRLDKLTQLLSDHIDNLVLLDVVDSTHAMARRLITDMDEEDQSLRSTLIISDHQECGEGRGGRRWESPDGGLYMSWMRSGLDSETIARLPMIAAAAAHRAITAAGVKDVRIKWPNDIQVGTRKIAGLLVFARHGESNWATVGLGVNLDATPVLDDGQVEATSVADHVEGGDPGGRRERLISEFVIHLSAALADPAPALETWRLHLVQQPGDTVRVRQASGKEVQGTLEKVSPEGFLHISVDGRERVITGGDLIEH